MRRIGRRIREFRQRKGRTLVDLFAWRRLAVSFLPQVDRGLLSIRSLCRAMGGLPAHFFAAPSGNSLVLKAGHPRSRLRTEDSGAIYNLLSGAMPERMLEAMIAEFQPRFQPPLTSHPGEEFGYVLEGTIGLQIENDKFVLEPGDSFHIFSSRPHTIRNLGPRTAKILWVLTPKLLEGGIATDGETSGC